MKFDLADFLELDTKALMAINGGGTCGGGSCSGGSRGSSSSSYGGSCSSGSSYGGSCGGGSRYGGSCSGSSYGGSCSGGSYGGSCGGGTSYGGSCGGGSSYGGSCSGSSYGGSCSGGTSYAGSCGGGNVVVKPYNPTSSEPEANLTLPPTEPISGSWGEITNETAIDSTMQEHINNDEVNSSMNGKDEKGDNNKFSLVGCKMEGASKILTEIAGKNVDITEVNSDYDTNKDGLMTQAEITVAIKDKLSEGQTVVSDYWEKQLTKEKLDEIVDNQNGTTYVLGRAEDVHGGQHWIVLEGYSINASGQVEFDYNGTSQNDANKNRKYILGELTAEQKANNYHQISKIETYTII